MKNATIAGANPESTLLSTSGIFASSSSGDVSLTISLQGENTITSCQIGIYVYSSTTGNASLTITGSGSLDASGSQDGIKVQSNYGGGTLEINSARIKAAGGTYGSGVWVQAQNDSDVSLTVDGGNLTSSGGTGISLVVGTGESGSGTPSLTVTGNATVDAKNGGIANNSSSTVQVGPGNENNGGIVFDGNSGTVYGSVELQDDLKISEGETLSIPEGASLNTNGKLTVNGGTLNGTPNGDVTYKVTGVSLDKTSLTLEEGDSETLNATVEPDNASNKNVNWKSSDTSIATVDASGKVTAISAGSATITATAADGSGKSASCSVTVTHGNMVHTPKKDATCTAEGNKEYWTCGTCGKIFSDAEGKTEIELSATVIPATGHNLTKTEEKAPTCTAEGNTEYWTCESCGTHYSDASATIEVDPSDLIIPQLSCPTQPTATYDDGGPFTTDQYGNVYDRWGNEIWHNPSPQSASNTTIGYQLVATIDK